MRSKKTTKRTAGNDLMSLIQQTSRQVGLHAQARGLAKYLDGGGEATVKPFPSADGSFDAAWLSYRFRPNFGVEFELLSIATGDGLAHPVRPTERAALLVDWMEWLAPRAAGIAARRTAIAAAAARVIAEARIEGIDMELLSVELAPVHAYVTPGERGGWDSVFYVNIVMDHDDDGVLTLDRYSIDADDPDEFADYMRRRVLAEIREDRARHERRAAA